MWNTASHNSKSNSMHRPPKQIKVQTRLRYSGWRSTAGADLIVTKAFVLSLVKVERGMLRIFPCCSLSPGSPPPPPPRLLEINGAGVISQQPALSPRTNQCDHEEGKSGIVFKRSKFTVGELVRFALSSFFPQEHFGRRMPPLTYLAELWSKR